MAGLPTGTLTFLFTDVEGSTRMWERDPRAMRSSLARHDEIVRSAIREHGGHVFKTRRASGTRRGRRGDPLAWMRP